MCKLVSAVVMFSSRFLEEKRCSFPKTIGLSQVSVLLQEAPSISSTDYRSCLYGEALCS